MEELSEIRKKIDKVDAEIIACLRKRVNLCESIGGMKRRRGIPIRDLLREKEKHRLIMDQALRLCLNPNEIKYIFERIITMSVHAQRTKRPLTTDSVGSVAAKIAKENLTIYSISEKVARLENDGKKVIKFNVGDPDQQTPVEIIDAMTKALKQGKTKYGSSAGEKNLKDELAKAHGCSSENIVITPGSKWAIFSVMYLLLKKGDNIILPSPHWTAYQMIAESLGIEVRTLNTRLDSSWTINPLDLEDLIDRNTQLLILNNPNNPTGKTMENEAQKEIVEIMNDKQIQILSDEAYSDFSPVRIKSILDFDGDHLLINSFSKTFAMTGWRIGYAIVNAKLARRMIDLNQHSITNVPVFIQAAAKKALEMKEKIAKEMREIYQNRADLAIKMLSRTKLEFTKPDVPFYLFPRRENLDSESLTLKLLERGVAITPGTSFGNYREHFRMALSVPEQEIKLGLERLCEAL
ncbi:MAG: aminotransferase class I/II-fold pyridoxal phosphate-dependent enzyme [Candidatus Bathyarchaeota archaeon]|nr:aminotransferase class I/II-fold pyridoxal phosphate-dependent enzyme [Candidatus Bathyarchaeota archaeon]